ncbi:MAG: lysoplasmalogenase family protein, partial [Bacteroidota bacterium]
MALILEHPSIPLYTKPLIMVLLIGWFLHSIKLKLNLFSVLMVAAFLFSLSGDVALMFQHLPAYQMYPMFLLGLSSFLIAQLNYAVAFHTYPSKEPHFLGRYPLMVVPFLGFWAWINWYLRADLANFQIPVLVYSA